MSTADAEAREAAWLNVTNDTLPVLIAPTGPFQVIQAFWPGAKVRTNATGIYVQRRKTRVQRYGGQRLMPGYDFFLKLVWPVKSTAAGIAETEAQNFANAVDLLIQRINGLPGDHTHGGRFLSVGEAQQAGHSVAYVDIDYADPEVTIPQGKWLRATATYPADDREFQG